MSTDFQSSREALGVRLRELRTEAGMEGKDLAAKLGWQASKVSRLQNGKQTPTAAEITAWAQGVGRPDAEVELQGLRAGLEMKHRSWRRQLAGGHRARQEVAIQETAATQMIRGLEVSRVPGLFQTPEYARVIFDANAEFRGIPPTTEAAVAARIRRQEALYEPGKSFRFLLCEAALYHRSCPADVMAEQLDRLYNIVGLRSVELGIIPFGAQLRRTAPHAFWIYDRRLVIVETISEELWLTGEADIRLYERAWEWLAESAERGSPARRLIGRARASLDLV
ncbi:helix-turn-helix domain-containing protein [Streptomyces mirabilis]|uniref:helix-turn-helix domain-containing protein n=1 Tax=Streptomyces TaxID=1883 RepID=UPI0011659879|nr:MULTISPECIES: helix-turn-helix transcriptional regulator [Streptomyces]MCX4423903.1 helix-turn-helix transcriptional regulator [Streptomyces mirabilis]QDN78306.1 helix-turn-helix domain-containing protein [Streptomyces sp. S1A1-7]